MRYRVEKFPYRVERIEWEPVMKLAVIRLNLHVLPMCCANSKGMC